MPRTCSVCENPNRDDIDNLLVSGQSLRDIATRYPPLTPSALSRHHNRHVSAALMAMQAQVQADGRASLVDRIEVLIGNAETMFAAAALAGHGAQALAVLKELRSQLELLGKADGSLATAPTVVVNLMASE